MIYPDNEGINVTYIPSEFSISSQKTILMIINTSMTLAPGEYIIETSISATTPSSTSYRKITVGEPKEEPLKESIDKTPDDTTEELGDIIEEPDGDETPIRKVFNLWLLTPLIIIPFIIFYMIKKKEKNEKNKESH